MVDLLDINFILTKILIFLVVFYCFNVGRYTRLRNLKIILSSLSISLVVSFIEYLLIYSNNSLGYESLTKIYVAFISFMMAFIITTLVFSEKFNKGIIVGIFQGVGSLLSFWIALLLSVGFFNIYEESTNEHPYLVVVLVMIGFISMVGLWNDYKK